MSFDTFEQATADLEAIESELASELGLGDARRELAAMAWAGTLVETKQVLKWHALYSRYWDWKETYER